MKRLICAMLSIALLLACAACGTPSAESTAQTSATSLSPSSSPESTFSGQTPASKPSAEPVPSSSLSTEPTHAPETSAEPTLAPEPEPEETVSVDPSSKLLPNIFTFLYHDRSYKTDGGHGRQINCNGSHPGASFEAVREELLALLAEDQYQLELADS